MLLSQHRLWTGTLLLFSVALSGCGGGTDKKPTGTPGAKEALTDLANLLKHHEGEKKRTPSRLADVELVEPVFQAAYLGLVRDEIVYLWGTPLKSSGGDKVVAYEKRSDDEPRWVLMQDGTLREMQASEFQAAPKATK